MKLSDQIALLTKTLDELGFGYEVGESAGEAASRLLRELAARVVTLGAALEEQEETIEDMLMGTPEPPEPDPLAGDELPPAGPVIPCDDCTYLDMGKTIPRLCQNVEAIRHHFARRGYSVAADHGCTLGRS